MSARCVYEGTVRHRRREPVGHDLQAAITMVYADIDERDAVPLRTLVACETGVWPTGPVRLLARPRGFNPVTFAFCFDENERVQAVVAEVTNTPWGERHRYVLPGTSGELDKAFHVSPFLGMDHRYAWRVTEPGERLAIHIAAGTTFDATLTLRRRQGRPRLAGRAPVRPRIYWHALRLKLKGAPYHPHPAR